MFDLYGLVIMPDHVHLAMVPICLPQGPIPIAEIMQAIKGASAHRINKLLNRRGKVWQEESFDRALRKEEQFTEKLYYMLANPVRARPGWQSAGLSVDMAANIVNCCRCRLLRSMERGAGTGFPQAFLWPGEDARRSIVRFRQREYPALAGIPLAGRGRPALHHPEIIGWPAG